MKFFKWLAIIIICFILFTAFSYISSYKAADSQMISNAVVSLLVLWIVFSIIRHYIKRSKLPGGARGAKLQGIWVLEKHLKFDPVMKKYEALPVEPKKNYFEFKGDQFRSGDFDEKHAQLPAEWSPFSIEKDNIIFGSEFLKKGNWRWTVKSNKLELIGETVHPEGKSQFIFYRKNWY